MGKKNKSQLKKRNRLQRVGAIAFLAPSLIGVFLFFILPFMVVMYYSMIDNPITANFVGFSNYGKVFRNGAFKIAAANTLEFSIMAVPLSVILSLILAIMLDRKIPFRSQFRTFFLTPMMVPVASIVLIVRVMFDLNGAVNQFVKGLGMAPIDWFNSEYANVVIVFLFLWKNLGYNMILFLAGLESIPKELTEVALLENANAWQIFWNIKIRYLSPTIMFVTILSLINSFKVFREIYLLTSDYPAELYMLQHFMNNTFKSLDYQKLSTAAIIMSLVMIVIIGSLFLVENHFGKDVEE